MLFLRRFGGPSTAILALVGISVLAFMTMRGGVKNILIRRDGIKFEKRDGSTITLTMPWPGKQVLPTPGKAKELSSDMDSIIGDIAAVASAIAVGGNRVASAASQGAVGIQPTQLSADSSLSSAGASSVLRDVNGQIQQATSIVAGVIGDATGIVGSILAAATNASNIGVLNSSTNTFLSTSSEPRELLPQTACKNCSGSISHNMTAAPSPSAYRPLASATNRSSTTPAATSCSAITKTCTVTETWHSTHYAETATLYSFIANFTTTCTETISACPTLNAYLLQPPAPTSQPLPNRNSLIACANGVLAKREEDCLSLLNTTTTFPNYSLNFSTSPSYLVTSTSTHPCPNAGYSCAECPGGWFCPPQQTPAQDCICGYGWACANCKDGFFCIPSPTAGGSGLVNSVASLLGSSIVTSRSSMFAGTTESPTLVSLGTVVPLSPGTITCVDGSAVLFTKDCLNGVLGATGTPNNVDLNTINKAMTAVPAATTVIDGLVGDFVNTADAGISPLVRISQLTPTASDTISARNIVSTFVADITSADGNLVPTATTTLNNAPILLESNPDNAVSPAALVVGHLSTIINGQSTVLPVVATIMNGNPTTIPILNTMMNGHPTNLPIVNTPAGQLAQALGRLGGRLSKVKKDEGGVKCDCVYEV